MKAAAAIRTFMNNGPTLNTELAYPPVSVMEIRDFKESMTPEEWKELARQACTLLGVTFEE